jgi:hypothetical protein
MYVHFSAPFCNELWPPYNYVCIPNRSQTDLSLFSLACAFKRVKMAWELSHSAKQISSFMMQKKVSSTKSLLFSTPYELDVAPRSIITPLLCFTPPFVGEKRGGGGGAAE